MKIGDLVRMEPPGGWAYDDGQAPDIARVLEVDNADRMRAARRVGAKPAACKIEWVEMGSPRVSVDDLDPEERVEWVSKTDLHVVEGGDQ